MPASARRERKAWCPAALCPSAGKPADDLSQRHVTALARLAVLDLGNAVLEPARPDNDLPGQSDQVHDLELAARTLIGVIIEHFDALGGEPLIDLLAGLIGLGIACLEIDEAELERRHGLRPDDAVLIVARLDDAADQARHANTIRPRLHRHLLPVRSLDQTSQWIRVLG